MFKAASSILGKEIDATITIVLVISVVIFLFITALALYFIIRYRRSRNRTPVDIPGSLMLETIWTVVPLIIVLVLFYYGWEDYKKRTQVPADALEIQVTAQQWSWSFDYGGGIKSNILKLPVNKPVKLVLSSQDVIHSLFIPAFRMKEDIVPGLRENYLWFTPDEVGTYDLFCTEHCGVGHSRMLAKVAVLDEVSYSQWYHDMIAELSVLAVMHGAELGKRLVAEKGCVSCHSSDGTELIGPTWKDMYLRRETVITEGKEREIEVDEEYLKKSLIDPNADVVKGFPPIMPSQKGQLTEEEIEALIKYLETL